MSENPAAGPPASALSALAAASRSLVVPSLAVLTAVIIGGLIIWLTGGGPAPSDVDSWPSFIVQTGLWRPILAYSGLVAGAFGSGKALSETAVWTTPYIFAGLAVAIAFKGGLFNIGAEGQLALGALVTAWLGFGLPNLTGPIPALIHVPLAIIGGSLAGAVWGGIPGWLKARTGGHEVINTIMMNYIALLLSSFLLNGPWKDPTPGNVVAQTPPIAASARLAPIIADSRFHWGTLLALVAAAVVYWLLWKTPLGFEIRTVGLNPSAARYAGIAVERTIVISMALSGLLAGLAGSIEVVALNYGHTLSFNIGYGFDAVTIALLGRSHPLGVVLAAILFGSMRSGASKMQFLTQVPVDIISVIQALVLLFVAADVIVRKLYRIRASGQKLVLTRGWGG